MKTVKILSLYGEALELNGDTMNIRAFTNRLDEMGYSWELVKQSVGDEIDFTDIDIAFICHGKPNNVSAVSGHFVKYKDKIISAIENGMPFVVTGSAKMLLGRDFTMLDGKTYEGIGLLDCSAEEFDGMYVSDAVLAPDFAPENKVFGTYYRCEKEKLNSPNEYPLFTVEKAGGGEGSVKDTEGVHYKNLFATWCLGPVLVRNPVMLKEVLKAVLKENYKETDFSLEEKAVGMILTELAK